MGDGPQPDKGRGHFDTTQWSLVRAAGRNDGGCEGEAALAALCQAYWRPLYVYVRSRGHSREEAEDLTQEFFYRLLVRKDISRADPARGRFRTFLLTAFQRHIENAWHAKRAQKRGGGVPHISLDFIRAEARWADEPAEKATPESIYERQWALELLERVVLQLRQEYVLDGRGAIFDALKPCLTGQPGSEHYAEIGHRLAMSEGAVKTAAHRLRRRFQRLLRDTVAETLNDPAAVEDELHALLAALR